MIMVGDVVRTSYGTGPYRVDHIIRGCTCPDYTDEINGFDDAPPSSPHLHLGVTGCGGDHNDGEIFALSGYDEDTLESVWIPGDRIEVVGSATAQLDMFQGHTP